MSRALPLTASMCAMMPMFLVRSRAALAADELSGAAAYRREECESDLSGAVRRVDVGCCLHSHLVNMPEKEKMKKRMCLINAPSENQIMSFFYVDISKDDILHLGCSLPRSSQHAAAPSSVAPSSCSARCFSSFRQLCRCVAWPVRLSTCPPAPLQHFTPLHH